MQQQRPPPPAQRQGRGSCMGPAEAGAGSPAKGPQWPCPHPCPHGYCDLGGPCPSPRSGPPSAAPARGRGCGGLDGAPLSAVLGGHLFLARCSPHGSKDLTRPWHCHLSPTAPIRALLGPLPALGPSPVQAGGKWGPCRGWASSVHAWSTLGCQGSTRGAGGRGGLCGRGLGEAGPKLQAHTRGRSVPHRVAHVGHAGKHHCSPFHSSTVVTPPPSQGRSKRGGLRSRRVLPKHRITQPRALGQDPTDTPESSTTQGAGAGWHPSSPLLTPRVSAGTKSPRGEQPQRGTSRAPGLPGPGGDGPH